MDLATRTTLVLGGTARVAERLWARGLPVRLGSRSGEPPFDWNEPATWDDALKDIAQMYISFYPDLAAPGTTSIIQSLTETAVSRGVRRLVLLSGRGEAEAQRCEHIVRDSGVEWTIVRASWFNQNFSEGYFLDPMITNLFTEVLDGRNASVTDGVSRALGRAPRDVRDYVRDAASAGEWSSEPATV